jgi:hypothetical protein
LLWEVYSDLIVGQVDSVGEQVLVSIPYENGVNEFVLLVACDAIDNRTYIIVVSIDNRI